MFLLLNHLLLACYLTKPKTQTNPSRKVIAMKIAYRAASFVALGLLLPAQAHAEEPPSAEESGDQALNFKDDPLFALSNEPLWRTLILRAGRPRPSLIRPRTHFLNELKSSVNAL